MCHAIECSRNEPADLYIVHEYVTCSQNIKIKFSADN